MIRRFIRWVFPECQELRDARVEREEVIAEEAKLETAHIEKTGELTAWFQEVMEDEIAASAINEALEKQEKANGEWKHSA